MHSSDEKRRGHSEQQVDRIATWAAGRPAHDRLS